MNKRQLIEAIRRINTSASAEFLDQFDDESLQQYLEHLEAASARRPRPQARRPERIVA